MIRQTEECRKEWIEEKKSYVFYLQYVSQAKPVREREGEREEEEKKNGKIFHITYSIYIPTTTNYLLNHV